MNTNRSNWRIDFKLKDFARADAWLALDELKSIKYATILFIDT